MGLSLPTLLQLSMNSMRLCSLGIFNSHPATPIHLLPMEIQKLNTSWSYQRGDHVSWTLNPAISFCTTGIWGLWKEHFIFKLLICIKNIRPTATTRLWLYCVLAPVYPRSPQVLEVIPSALPKSSFNQEEKPPILMVGVPSQHGPPYHRCFSPCYHPIT